MMRRKESADRRDQSADRGDQLAGIADAGAPSEAPMPALARPWPRFARGPRAGGSCFSKVPSAPEAEGRKVVSGGPQVQGGI